MFVAFFSPSSIKLKQSIINIRSIVFMKKFENHSRVSWEWWMSVAGVVYSAILFLESPFTSCLCRVKNEWASRTMSDARHMTPELEPSPPELNHPFRAEDRYELFPKRLTPAATFSIINLMQFISEQSFRYEDASTIQRMHFLILK